MTTPVAGTTFTIINAEEDVREARKAAMGDSDPRYEHVLCATCQGRFQRIDFRCALHLALCEKPIEPPLR